MFILEILVGAVLVLILLGLAGYFAVRQKSAVRRLRTEPSASVDDKRYILAQTRRRMLCSILMVVLAGMLVGWYFLRDDLQPVPAQANDGQAEVKMTEAQKTQLRWATMYWCVALLVIFLIACLALMDFMATARFSHRLFRNLEDQRQEALKDELAKWRSNRNGFT